MKTNSIVLVVCLFFILSTVAVPQENCKPQQFAKTAVTVPIAKLDANNLALWIQNNGLFGSNPTNGSLGGLEFPRNTDKYLLYSAGLWVSGIVGNSVRSACTYYSSEYQPGRILPDGRAADSTDATFRLYKIAKRYTAGGNPDYDNWPWQYGAPADTLTHKPIFYGDQQVWGVFNDLDNTKHVNVFQTRPLGIEVQALFWAYDRPEFLANTIFMSYKIINKSDEVIKATYIGLFMDPDLGDASNDLPGCDPALNLAYWYNAMPNDRDYGTMPPSAGTLILQGALIPSSGDTAFYPDGRIVANTQLLGMTSFTPFF